MSNTFFKYCKITASALHILNLYLHIYRKNDVNSYNIGDDNVRQYKLELAVNVPESEKDTFGKNFPLGGERGGQAGCSLLRYYS